LVQSMQLKARSFDRDEVLLVEPNVSFIFFAPEQF
jgi:hypothetical protein